MIHRLNDNVARFLKLTGKMNIWCLCALKSHDPLMNMEPHLKFNKQPTLSTRQLRLYLYRRSVTEAATFLVNAPHVLTLNKCIILLQALRRSRFHYYNVPDDHTPTQYKQQDASLCALDSLFLQGFTYVSKCVSELVLRVATAEYSDMRCAA